jgi:hypothetical protein
VKEVKKKQRTIPTKEQKKKKNKKKKEADRSKEGMHELNRKFIEILIKGG